MDLRIHDAGLERSDRKSIASLQLKKLKALLLRAWETNSFYRDHWRRAGTSLDQVASLSDFAARFPLVRKGDFIADQRLAPPFGRRAAHALSNRAPMMVYHTSGTTGRGVEVHVQTRREAAAVHEVYRYLYRWAGLEPGDHVFVCYPVSMQAGGQMDVDSLQAFGCTVYPVGNYEAARKLELLESFKPRAISGTPSYLLHLGAASGDHAPRQSVEVLVCSGESGGGGLLQRLERQWDARVAVFYGASQLRADPLFTCEQGIGAGDGSALLHNIDPYFLLEVVSPRSGLQVKDGEAGELVFTSLIHSDVPLFRCATGDKAVYREAGSCRCGRPFGGVALGSIERIDDMRKIKGVNVWPQAVDDLLFSISEIHEYQVTLRRDESETEVAIVRLMLEGPGASERAEGLRSRVAELLRERIGLRFEVELTQHDAVLGQQYKTRRWIDERSLQ